MTPSGIEPATFWLVAQCLNQLRYLTLCSFLNERGGILFQQKELAKL
jgi:hypothetical protein